MTIENNRLGQETSPYLLQHQHNPVHWQAWSAETLALAGRTDRPVLLSVGYAACHWCHVMAHELREREPRCLHASSFSKTARDGRATAYVCQGMVCSLPIVEPEALAAAPRET